MISNEKVNFQNQIFNDIDLEEESIEHYSYRKSVFIETPMVGSKFYDVDFRETSWRKANAAGSTFKYCDFSGADLSMAQMNNCTFDSCAFSNTKMPDYANGATFHDCIMEGTSANHCKFRECTFQLCIMIGINFYESKLEKTVFNGCRLSLANFTKAKLNDTQFYRNTLTKAIFTFADLRGSNLVDYEPAVLQGAYGTDETALDRAIRIVEQDVGGDCETSMCPNDTYLIHEWDDNIITDDQGGVTNDYNEAIKSGKYKAEVKFIMESEKWILYDAKIVQIGDGQVMHDGPYMVYKHTHYGELHLAGISKEVQRIV